jgi:amidohydrolase
MQSQERFLKDEKVRLSLIRSKLHETPEYSGQEEKTASMLLEYLKETAPDKIYKGVGGNGIIVEYIGTLPGHSKMFRCEMDAINTDNGMNHLCGHDGHMAILIGLAQRVSANRDFPGKVYLLFQPAEETGEGAARMTEDIERVGLKFDYSFALHNRPGEPLGVVIIDKGTYAAASTGMELHFEGRQSHAANPEEAISPVKAIISVIQEAWRLNNAREGFGDFILATVVNVEIGEVNYGVTPGEGYLRFTLRGFRDEDLELLCEKITAFAKKEAAANGLELTVSKHDQFPATINSDQANEIVINAAQRLNMKVVYSSGPSRASDDFCHFGRRSKASYFDIGNGTESASLHQMDYRFSDEIIIPSLDLLSEIVYRQ